MSEMLTKLLRELRSFARMFSSFLLRSVLLLIVIVSLLRMPPREMTPTQVTVCGDFLPPPPCWLQVWLLLLCGAAATDAWLATAPVTTSANETPRVAANLRTMGRVLHAQSRR